MVVPTKAKVLVLVSVNLVNHRVNDANMAQPQLNQHLALEMAMQDVMDNMEELALDFGFADGESCFEILAVEATDVPDAVTSADRSALCRSPFTAEIQPLPNSRYVA